MIVVKIVPLSDEEHGDEEGCLQAQNLLHIVEVSQETEPSRAARVPNWTYTRGWRISSWILMSICLSLFQKIELSHR